MACYSSTPKSCTYGAQGVLDCSNGAPALSTGCAACKLVDAFPRQPAALRRPAATYEGPQGYVLDCQTKNALIHPKAPAIDLGY